MPLGALQAASDSEIITPSPPPAPPLPSALHYLQRSPLFSGMSEHDLAQLANACELVPSSSSSSSPLLLGSNDLLLGEFALTLRPAPAAGGGVGSIRASSSLMGDAAAPAPAPPPPPQATEALQQYNTWIGDKWWLGCTASSTIAPLVFATGGASGNTPTPATSALVLSKHSSTSSLLWVRRSFANDSSSLSTSSVFAGNSNSGGGGALSEFVHAVDASSSSSSSAAVYRLDAAALYAPSTAAAILSVLESRAMFRDAQVLAKYTMYSSSLFTSEYAKEYAAFCQLWEFRPLSDEALLNSSEQWVVLVVDGTVDASLIITTGEKEDVVVVRCGQFGRGSLLRETPSLFPSRSNASKEEVDGGAPPRMRYTSSNGGLALCLDCSKLVHDEVMTRLPAMVRQRFEEEWAMRDSAAHFQRLFAPWFNYAASPAWLELLLDVCVCLPTLHEGELVNSSSMLDDCVLLVHSGEVSVSHFMKRRPAGSSSHDRSGAFMWWVRPDEDQQLLTGRSAGDLVLTKRVADKLLLDERATAPAAAAPVEDGGGGGGDALKDHGDNDDDSLDDPFEVRATANDTRVYAIPSEVFKAVLQHSGGVLAADFELRVLRDQARFDCILAHPVARYYFRQYLDSVQATENLDFWLEAKAFAEEEEEDGNGGGERDEEEGVATARAVAAADSEDEEAADEEAATQDPPPSRLLTLEERAQRIFDQFVASTSPKQINLPAAKRLSLESSILTERASSNLITRDLFHAASLECYSLMTGCLPRFLRSDLAKQMYSSVALGTSLEDCINPPPPTPLLSSSSKDLSPHKLLMRASGGGGGAGGGGSMRMFLRDSGGGSAEGGGSWRRRSSSSLLGSSSPRLSFTEAGVGGFTPKLRSSLSLTPRSGPLKSPLASPPGAVGGDVKLLDDYKI